MTSRPIRKLRSPRRMDYRPQSEAQAMMTYDHKQGMFVMFEEQIHRQTIQAGIDFDAAITLEREQQQEPQDYISQDYAQTFPIKDYAVEWKYEYTGMAYKESSNYYLWWAKHKHFKQWFANIKTRDEQDLWVSYEWVQRTVTIEDDLDNIIRAIRVECDK